MVNPVKGVFQKIREWGQASAERGHRASAVEDKEKPRQKVKPQEAVSEDTLAPHPKAPKPSSRQEP